MKANIYTTFFILILIFFYDCLTRTQSGPRKIG